MTPSRMDPLPELPPDAELALSTPRLNLEPVLAQHAEELWRLLGDPELHRFVPFEPGTLEALRERTERWARRRSPSGDELWLNWAARERVSDEVVAHFQAGVKEGGVASIGYVVGRARQRAGYAAEGMLEVLGLLRERFGVKEAKAWIDTRNEASIRLAEKLGMKRVELIRGADFFKGASSDEYVYALSLG